MVQLLFRLLLETHHDLLYFFNTGATLSSNLPSFNSINSDFAPVTDSNASATATTFKPLVLYKSSFKVNFTSLPSNS